MLPGGIFIVYYILECAYVLNSAADVWSNSPLRVIKLFVYVNIARLLVFVSPS